MENQIKRLNHYTDKLSQAVTHYQPLAEQRFSDLTGQPICLGEVQTKDMKDLGYDVSDYHHQKSIQFVVDKKGSINPLEKGIIWFFQKVIFKPRWQSIVAEHIERGDLIWFNNAIYFSCKRTEDKNANTDEQIQQDAVHELSHGFWEKLGGEDQFDYSIKNMSIYPKFAAYSEEFALYCEQFLFRNLFPEEVQRKIRQELQSPRQFSLPSSQNQYEIERNRARKKIEQLVEECGEQVLVEIPRGWRKL